MKDSEGRKIDHLRISLTNRCNLNCIYCHKEGNHVSTEEMGTEKVFEILNSAKKTGIEKIKFTGGEPFLRKDIFEIIEKAMNLDFSDVSITTNGSTLEKDIEKIKASGLKRINIGCDSIIEILPKNLSSLEKGILKARDTGLDIKLNMVVMKCVNDGQVLGMLDFCKKNKINLQLIELIDLDTENFERYHVPLKSWENIFSDTCDEVVERSMQKRKRFYFGDVFVEVVRPRHDFCEKCTKIRITADGNLRPCLMNPKISTPFNVESDLVNTIKNKRGYGYD